MKPRDRSGRFADRDFEKLCTCGHRLGEHDAADERRKIPTGACQECRTCEVFRAARKKNPRARAGFRAPKVSGPRKGPLPALRLLWLPLIVDRAWNEAARKLAHERSGIYVVRDKRTGAILYVGESHTDRLWKTLIRHFQDASGKFAKVSEWTHANPGICEVAIVLTDKGQAALDLQAKAIAKYQPAKNLDDGTAEERETEAEGEDDFFAQFTRENPMGKRKAKAKAKPRAKARAAREPAHRARLRRFAGAIVSVRESNPGPVPREAEASTPTGELVNLGALTELEIRSRIGNTISSWRWSLKSAPALAVDARGKLFIVYKPRPVGDASSAARRKYARLHWGVPGHGERLEGSIVAGRAKVIGASTRITYATRKGTDPALVDYVHAWGEGATGAWSPPLVVAHGDRVALAGGTYRVNERGIVG